IVGAHIFYRWAGGWGRPGAFAKSYSGREPNATMLRNAALAAEAATANQPSADDAQLLAAIPGAELKNAPPGRVSVRLNLEAARKAAIEAPHEDYAKKFDASDNLKWSLSNDTVASDEKPLGKAQAANAATGSASQR